MMSILKSNTLQLALAGAVICVASNLPAQDTPGRWYLGLDTGVALQQDITLENNGGNKLFFDPGFRLDLSGGVHLSRSWKAEVEVGFTYNSVEGRGLEYFQVPIMANGIYTLPIHGPISAYVGAGLGGVSTMLWNDNFWGGSEESFTFGYQGILGAKYAINDNLDLGLSYKLLGTIEQDLGPYRLDGTWSHSILAAFTFKF